MNLSEGQKQKLAILRALYTDPEIILFDEATSALDAKSEEAVINTMLKLRKEDKTIITISHRLSSITMVDTIVVMEKGQVIGEGSHNNLLENSKEYRSFWNKQMKNI